nr:MAG TPA: hypothetical protein [Caudoviricetes sp.]
MLLAFVKVIYFELSSPNIFNIKLLFFHTSLDI